MAHHPFPMVHHPSPLVYHPFPTDHHSFLSSWRRQITTPPPCPITGWLCDWASPTAKSHPIVWLGMPNHTKKSDWVRFFVAQSHKMLPNHTLGFAKSQWLGKIPDPLHIVPNHTRRSAKSHPGECQITPRGVIRHSKEWLGNVLRHAQSLFSSAKSAKSQWFGTDPGACPEFTEKHNPNP